MPGLSTDAVLTLLREVAAEVITPRFRALAEGEVIEKNPGDLVTIADREAEEIITAALLAAYPDAVVLGEEAHSFDHAVMDRYLGADHAFTVDPVDGTKNFVHGSPDHAVMVAETVSGETVRAWIWQPEHEVAWVAERGAGTWCDGVRWYTTPVASDDQPRGVTSIWAMRDQQLGDLPKMGLSWVCCGVDYPQLISGSADYVLYSRTNPWDHAPGALLVTEAGGYVGHPDGSVYSPTSLRPGLIAAADHATYVAVQRHTRAAFTR
jgi:fructose-1,6-bisphosphatase/inositol monophosphatase family enzyme